MKIMRGYWKPAGRGMADWLSSLSRNERTLYKDDGGDVVAYPSRRTTEYRSALFTMGYRQTIPSTRPSIVDQSWTCRADILVDQEWALQLN